MGTVAMSFFFMTTGFLLFRDLSMSNYLRKMKNRIFSLLIPFIVWQCITMFVYVLQGSYAFSISSFLHTTFGLLQWPLNGPLWYVFAVFLMALASPILLFAFRNIKTGWWFVVAAVFLVEVRGCATNPWIIKICNYGYIENILYYLPCYLVGAYYGKFGRKQDKYEDFFCLTSIIVLAFILNISIDGLLEAMTVKMLPLLAIYCLPVPSAFDDSPLYHITFLIYALQALVISNVSSVLINSVYPRILLPVTIYNITTKCVILAVDIFAAAIIYKVLRRVSPKALNILTGGRG